MAGFDLGSIIAQATQLSGTQAQQSQGIADLNIQSQDLSNQAAQNISEAGGLQAQAQLVELQGKLETQKQRTQAANAFGTNVGDVSDIITQLGQGMREDAIKLTQAQARVSEIEANSDLLMNPLGWLTDLLQGDEARAQRNALAQSFDTKQKLAQGLNSATQQTAQTQNAISETLSAASIQQTAEATKLLADAEVTKAKIQGAQYGANAIEALRQNGAQDFNRSMQVYSQITDEARYQEGLAMRQEQFKALQEQRKKGKLEDQEYVDATTRVNTYRSAAGLPPVNETFVRRTLTQGGDLGDDIRRQEASGMKLQGGSVKVFGETPSQTISILQKDTPTLPDSFAPSVSILRDASALTAEEINRRALNPTTDIKKDKAAQSQLLDSTVKSFAAQAQSNIQTGKGNPYEAPPIETILSEPNGLKDSKFGKVVLQTLVATGQPNPSPDMIIAMGLEAVNKGELSLNEARDGITSFYENAVGIKNATGGFLQLGVPPQQGYKTRISSFQRSFWDSVGGGLVLQGGLNAPAEAGFRAQEKLAAKPLDLTKSTDVTLALTLMKTKKLSDDILKRTNP